MIIFALIEMVTVSYTPLAVQEASVFEEALMQYDAYISEAAYLIPQIDVDILMPVTLIRYAPRTSEVVRTACDDSTQNEMDSKSMIHSSFLVSECYRTGHAGVLSFCMYSHMSEVKGRASRT